MCHHRFRLPKGIAVTDEAIAEWLWQGREREEDESRVRAPTTEVSGAAEKRAFQGAGSSGETQVLPVLTEQIRLIRADSKGALFEFPVARLKDADFRCAMPRRCIRCGTRSHLAAHVIIYAPRLVDSFSLESEHSAGELVISSERLGHLDGQSLLDALPEVPNVPEPAKLPMPYWICDMCTGKGMISGQIQIDPAGGGRGLCRLFIRNLRRAEEFLIRAGGRDTHDHSELRRRITASAENPWDNLPEVVQHRLGTWYNPAPGERFVAYVPDRDLARTEDGMSGLVVSNMRLIYHTRLRHRESKISESLKLQLSMSASRGRLRIKSPSWQIKSFTIDRDGVSRLRRALTAAKFNAVWY